MACATDQEENAAGQEQIRKGAKIHRHFAGDPSPVQWDRKVAAHSSQSNAGLQSILALIYLTHHGYLG